MLQNTKHDLLLRDPLCVFAVSRGPDGKFRLISPRCGHGYASPSNAPWAMDGGQFGEDGGAIETQVSLAGKPMEVSFAADFSVRESQVPSLGVTKAQAKLIRPSRGQGDAPAEFSLFRQGTDAIDGVLDISLAVAKCSDGLFAELEARLHLQRGASLNVEKFTCRMDSEPIFRRCQFAFTASASGLCAMLYIGRPAEEAVRPRPAAGHWPAAEHASAQVARMRGADGWRQGRRSPPERRGRAQQEPEQPAGEGYASGNLMSSTPQAFSISAISLSSLNRSYSLS